MKVSIVTPSFNQGKFIERTLQSVASQLGAEIEHVVFDGGSTDNTVEILGRFSPPVRWVSKKDKGQADAVNQGIRATDGEIIGWLNSDDIYYPGTIARVVAFFKANPEIDLVYGMADHIDVEDHAFEPYPTEPWDFERLKDNCFICQPALFFRRRVVEKYGLLDESLNYCMDYAYWLRLGQNGARFAYLEEKLAGSRLYAENKTMGATVKVHKEINDMFKKLFDHVPDKWLVRYTYVAVWQHTSRKIEDEVVLIKLMSNLILSSIRWNRGISVEVRNKLYQWFDQCIDVMQERFHLKFEKYKKDFSEGFEKYKKDITEGFEKFKQNCEQWINEHRYDHHLRAKLKLRTHFKKLMNTLLHFFLRSLLKVGSFIYRLIPAKFDAQKLKVKEFVNRNFKLLYDIQTIRAQLKLRTRLKKLISVPLRFLLRDLLKVGSLIYCIIPARFDAQKLRVKLFILGCLEHLNTQPNLFQMSHTLRDWEIKYLWGFIGDQDSRIVHDRLLDISTYLMAHSEELAENASCPITRFMYFIWRTRPDLLSAFDLHKPAGRLEYCKWFLVTASKEYGLTADAHPQELLTALSKVADTSVAAKALEFLEAKKQVGARLPSGQVSFSEDSVSQPFLAHGANLIGYARGEFGMGEHVRMSARSFAAAETPFSVINCSEAGIHGTDDNSIEEWIGEQQVYAQNIFHINADMFPPLYYRFGKEFFEQHYNIGYWAWELSKCPPEFDLALNMVDEVWTLSEFVRDAFKSRTSVSVINMSMAVSIPEFKCSYSKDYFGMPEDNFLFLNIFDAASYMDRKNPIAAVRAFKIAFPKGDEKVRLVLKTMNVRENDPLWQALMGEAHEDARIRVMNQRLNREEVLGLNSVCDAFVSLHRSEGFGLCIAESMLLGKPAISTNYSGSREFAREGTACVVDYELVPVKEGSYPLCQGQVWAEPDIEHAAYLMHKLFKDEGFRKHIAQAGQRYVKQNFNAEVIGKRYAMRLSELEARGFKKGLPPNKQSESLNDDNTMAANEIIGKVELPIMARNARSAPSGAMEVVGWALSKSGIKKIDVYCDKKFVGQAHYGAFRPDVAEVYPNYRNSSYPGFYWLLDTTNMAEGKHELAVAAYSQNGEVAFQKLGIRVGNANAFYQKWVDLNAFNKAKRRVLRSEIKAHADTLLIALVIIADENLNKNMLIQTLNSLKNQVYEKWELIICADSKVAPNVKKQLDTVDIDSRIKLATFEIPTWQEIFAVSKGDYIGVVNIGDILDGRLTWAIAKNAEAIPDASLIYADEDQLEDGNHIKPNLKPVWSPIFLQNYNYIGRPWFGKASQLKGVSCPGEPCNVETEHALLIRLGKIANKVVHVPMVLCSRRSDFDQLNKCIQGTGHGTGLHKGGANKLKQLISDTLPMVSVVIPTCLRNLDIIEKCFSSLLLRTDYPNLEVIVVKNNIANEEGAQRFLERWPFKVASWNGSFNWSAINNFGAQIAKGELLLFMNDDVEALNRDWLANMVEIAVQEQVGAAGALLMYPNQTIQHGGIYFINYGGGARHLFRYCSGTETHIAPMLKHNHESSAVTGACLLSRREAYGAINGFDEQLPLVNNDTDYCLRLEEKGLSCVVAAGATLVHHEGISRAGMSEIDDNKRFKAKWKQRLESCDPFMHPNLNDHRDDWWLNPDLIGTLNGRVRSGTNGTIKAVSS